MTTSYVDRTSWWRQARGHVAAAVPRPSSVNAEYLADVFVLGIGPSATSDRGVGSP
jgi:hypothetical protein